MLKENLLKKIIRFLSNYELTDKNAVVLLIFSLIFFFSPLLFFGKILLNGDATYYAYPVGYFFHHFYGFTINDFLFSGYPVADAFQIGYFHPLNNLFFKFFDFIFAYHTLIFLDFFGAAVFTYLFTRKIGLSIQASLLASIVYTFSQYSIAWLGVLSVAKAVFLLPALMYSVIQIIDLRKKFVIIFGVVLGVGFLGTHYHFLIVCLIGVGAIFLFEVWQRWSKEEPLINNSKPLFFIIIGMTIAVVISLPQALHSLNFFDQSTRILMLTYSSAPHIDLFKFFIPTFNVPNMSVEDFRPYIGIIPLFFSMLCLYLVISKRIIDRRVVFYSWFFIVTLIMSLKYSPFLIIMKYIPFLKYFVGQARWMHLSVFALIVLAAYGFDFVMRKKEMFFTDRIINLYKRILQVMVGLFTVLNLVIIFFGEKLIIAVQNYFDSNLYANTTHQPIKYYHDLIEVLVERAFMNVSFVNPNILIFLFFALSVYFLMKVFDRKLFFANLVIILTMINLLSVSALTLRTGDRGILLDKSNIAEFIKSQEKSSFDYRVFGFMVPFAQYQQITALHPEAEIEATIFAKEALMGNLSVFSEIPMISGYEPMMFRRYQNLLTFLEDSLAKKTIEEKSSSLLEKLPLLSALNVKYIVSPYILNSGDLDLVFSETVTSFNVPLYLYKNKEVLPRFYLAKNTVFLSENDEDKSLIKVTEKGVNFDELTFIECDNCQYDSEQSNKSGTSELISRDNASVKIKVKIDHPEWLVLSYENVPGWNAKIDGVPVPIYYANHAYQAVQVPKGVHTVEFFYSVIPRF